MTLPIQHDLASEFFTFMVCSWSFRSTRVAPDLVAPYIAATLDPTAAPARTGADIGAERAAATAMPNDPIRTPEDVQSRPLRRRLWTLKSKDIVKNEIPFSEPIFRSELSRFKSEKARSLDPNDEILRLENDAMANGYLSSSRLTLPPASSQTSPRLFLLACKSSILLYLPNNTHFSGSISSVLAAYSHPNSPSNSSRPYSLDPQT